jgi:hypothetical protein
VLKKNTEQGHSGYAFVRRRRTTTRRAVTARELRMRNRTCSPEPVAVSTRLPRTCAGSLVSYPPVHARHFDAVTGLQWSRLVFEWLAGISCGSPQTVSGENAVLLHRTREER